MIPRLVSDPLLTLLSAMILLLSASLLGDRLDKRRNELRATLPIGRVVGPADVAALAVHLMSNTALTGATYDIDGGTRSRRCVSAAPPWPGLIR